MNVIARPVRLTPEEFEQMSGTEGLELVDGFPREKSMGLESSFVNNEFGAVIRNFAREHRLGWVFDSESGFQCFPARPRLVRKPDVAFVRRGRFPDERLPKGYGRIPPDLAVEVVSPKDTWYQVEEIINDYLSAGVPMIWVVNPDSRTVHVYRPDGSVLRLRETDDLTGDPVLPGFRVRLADLLPPAAPRDPEPTDPPADVA